MILRNRKEWEEDKGLWLRKDRYPRENKRYQPFINGCNMKGSRWPRQYWRNIIRMRPRNRIELLWVRLHCADTAETRRAQAELEAQLDAIGSPFNQSSEPNPTT
jgi:hypothetical protein